VDNGTFFLTSMRKMLIFDPEDNMNKISLKKNRKTSSN